MTVLWFGGGQDSTALLYLSHYSKEFQDTYIGNTELIVVMSDTGNEYPDTYSHVAEISEFCRIQNISFHFLTKEQGFHSKTWMSLQAQMEKNSSIMSVALPKSCTDKLKIGVCYNFLGKLISEKYGYNPKRKKMYYDYKEEFGKLKVLIGFAKGEESRMVNKDDDQRPLWMQRNVDVIYPLIEMGIDRQECQNIISSYGHNVPSPSNCMLCPFQSDPEIVYLHKFHPKMWEYWVEREAAKIAKNAEKPKNLGVKGRKTLPETLEIAMAKYGHWSNLELIEYRHSHGHCVMSRY